MYSFESKDDSLIGFVALRAALKRRKENSGNVLANILLAEFPRLIGSGRGIRCQITPKQGMLGRLGSFRHSLGDRTEDLRVGDIGKQIRFLHPDLSLQNCLNPDAAQSTRPAVTHARPDPP